MKSKSNIIFLLVLLVILSSCGSLSVSKMRYSRGLNINLSVRETADEEHKAKVAAKNKSTAKGSMSKNIVSDETLVVQTSVDETKEKDEIQSYSSSNIRSGSSSSSSSNFKGLKNSIKKNIAPGYKAAKQINLNKTNFRSPGKQETNDESGVALLLLVIIALFVPPLAVLLYFGEINGQFWISLLLTLLALGAFGLGFVFGWGVPVIHALLVIFGIFD